VIAIFGGGEIAEHGIVPLVGETKIFSQSLVDVQDAPAVRLALYALAADAVVYTAGVSRPTSVADGDYHTWRPEFGVNVLGAFVVASEAIKAGVKTLVFVASLAGLYGKPNHAGYSASKAALISLVQSLAMDGHNAYAISPGRVNTSMRERDYPGEDPLTRLHPHAIGLIVADILAGKYTPGDNVIVRMRGHEMLPLEIHRGDGWRERLRVGEPPTC
jgi:NAD(P)-dependent dehydrogenase (short-subunit alcohol dehydrogenase family)